MDDWRTVTDAEPWLVSHATAATIQLASSAFRPPPLFEETFPKLAVLLSQARRTIVEMPSGRYTLFAWGTPQSGVRAWLCPLPPEPVPTRAATDHRILLAGIGGITQRFNEPSDSLLLNHDDALTAPEVERDASFLTDYEWAFEESGGIPIRTADWYPAAWEANGNCVLCSRGSGELLFFAPDHSDLTLIPYAQCPPYTLHIRPQMTSLREWVEALAVQWAAGVAGQHEV